MDDPWANAWGEPSKPNLSESSILANTSTWAAPSVSVIQGDHEDDISTPSWPVRPTKDWNEDVADTSLWGGESSAAWNPAPSSFDRMSLASRESDTTPEPSSAAQTSEDVEEPSLSPTSTFSTDDNSQKSTNSPRHKSPEAPALSPSLAIPSTSLVPSDDLDAFGTFETAVEPDDAEGWASPRPAFSLPSENAWDAEPWGTPALETEVEATKGSRGEDVEDAWERARQQKAKRDLHVPPELLASILRHFEEISPELWPLGESPEDKVRNADLESLGLQSVLARLVPDDLILPTNTPFSKTFTSKQLSEALRLTRHSLSTRASPIALYMASKGSTSWEAAVKAKPTIGQEDPTPAGWKIVEAAKEEVANTDDSKRKPNGGLLSFFQRKATNPPDDSRRSASPVSVSGIATVKTGASPRASLDSTRSSAAQSQVAGRSTPSSPNVTSFGSISKPYNESTPKPPTPTTAVPNSSDPVVRVPTPPAPSAVSRFLGRFSGRTRSSSRDSLALSSDDLEFLSDVPTAPSGDVVDNGASLDALSMMIKSSPFPTKLPAPLAPPPRAPPPPSRESSQPLKPRNQPAQNEDFMSFFDTLDNPLNNTAASESPLSLLTAVPTPPVKPATPQIPSLPVTSLPILPITQSPPIPPISVTIPDQAPDQTRTNNSEEQPWPTFDYPSMPTNKIPSSQTKRPFVAIMSSSRPSSGASTPPLLPKPISTFSIPPPPSSNQRPSSNGASGYSNGLSSFPPPPSSRSHTPLRTQPAQVQLPPPNLDDDDDFADFLSSPAQATDLGSLSFNSFGSTTAPALAPPPAHPTPAAANISDDFDDFIDPIPPRPPAKPTTLRLSPAPSASFSPKLSKTSPPPQDIQTALNRKPTRKADHSRTLSLLETAAARGRWLAPPSPLPEALPPPNSQNGKSSEIDFFDGGSGSMQAQQASYLTNSLSTPTLGSNGLMEPAWNFPAANPATLQPPPVPQSMRSAPLPQSMQPSFSGYPAPKQPLFQPSVTQNGKGSATPAGTKTGGLSAQDLSFFEGL